MEASGALAVLLGNQLFQRPRSVVVIAERPSRKIARWIHRAGGSRLSLGEYPINLLEANMTPQQNELIDQIIKWRAAYYDGKPVVSDSVYDAAEEQLKRDLPAHPLLRQVGAPASGKRTIVRHEIPMGSLSKVKNKGDLATVEQGIRDFMGNF